MHSAWTSIYKENSTFSIQINVKPSKVQEHWEFWLKAYPNNNHRESEITRVFLKVKTVHKTS